MGADRMLLTDCYLLKLSGVASSTSAKNETAAVSKAVPGAKFGSSLWQGRRALFILSNNCDCTNKVSTDHHTAKIQQKSAVVKLVSLFITIHCNHTTQYIHTFSVLKFCYFC